MVILIFNSIHVHCSPFQWCSITIRRSNSFVTAIQSLHVLSLFLIISLHTFVSFKRSLSFAAMHYTYSYNVYTFALINVSFIFFFTILHSYVLFLFIHSTHCHAIFLSHYHAILRMLFFFHEFSYLSPCGFNV